MKAFLSIATLGTLIMGTLMLISCETEDAENVNQDRIETNYWLSYSATNDRTRASASFSFGSTYLKLNRPSVVLCNDSKMSEEEIFGVVSYEKEFNGPVLVGTFEYINEDDEQFVNNIELAHSIDIPSTLTQLSIASGEEIFWVGDPVAAMESITLSVYNDSTTFTRTVNAVNARSVVIPANALSQAFLGQSTISIKRTKQGNLDQAPDAGGSSYTEWSSLKYTITVTQ